MVCKKAERSQNSKEYMNKTEEEIVNTNWETDDAHTMWETLKEKVEHVAQLICGSSDDDVDKNQEWMTEEISKLMDLQKQCKRRKNAEEENIRHKKINKMYRAAKAKF